MLLQHLRVKKMRDKVVEEIRQNRIWDPERFERIKAQAESAEEHYREVIGRKRRSADKVIRFAAYVANDAMYGMDKVFRLMQKQADRWDPAVVIIPDVSRGYPHQKQTYLRTREYFIRLYGADRVLDGWDMQTDRYIDVTDRFDIIYFADPYDAMAPEVHSIHYAATRNVLPVYLNYGYDVGYYTMYARMKGPELNLVWKYFTETVFSQEDCRKLQVIQGKNVVLTGYAKMDELAQYPVKQAGERKKILITSHHSVNMEELPLSNFRTYHELLLQLPELFPETDFVFRPHPLMFIRLINEKIWTENQVDCYLEELKRAGIEYSDGGDYLYLFAECDAIINDCGSFTMEWLFTGKPGCFVLNEDLKEEHLTTQMKEALTRYRIARGPEDILRFISDVAAGPAFAKPVMDDWVRDNIAVNYPHAAERILEEMDILREERL